MLEAFFEFAKGEDEFSNRNNPVTFAQYGSPPPVPLAENANEVHSDGTRVTLAFDEAWAVGEYRTVTVQLCPAAIPEQVFPVIENGAARAPTVILSVFAHSAAPFRRVRVFSADEFTLTFPNANAVDTLSVVTISAEACAAGGGSGDWFP